MTKKRERRMIICPVCGREFEAPTKRRKFCSNKCCCAWWQAKMREQRNIAPLDPETIERGKNRELTEDTPYLCQKWLMEGDSVEMIAEALGRSLESVQRALEIPLSDVQRKTMEANLWPRKR